jgi:hypothetical protein
MSPLSDPIDNATANSRGNWCCAGSAAHVSQKICPIPELAENPMPIPGSATLLS